MTLPPENISNDNNNNNKRTRLFLQTDITQSSNMTMKRGNTEGHFK